VAILALALAALVQAHTGSSLVAVTCGTPVAIAIALFVSRWLSDRSAIGSSVVLVIGASIAVVGSDGWVAILILAGVGGAWLSRILAVRFPRDLDGALRRRRGVASLTGLVAVLGLAQGTRLAVFMGDPTQVWASSAPFVAQSAEHECLSAYLYAGELSARGVADVYDPALYPFEGEGGHGDGNAESQAPETVDTAVDGMEGAIQDPFLYPPPFLLLPRAALALSHDYSHLRLGVFVANSLVFLIVGLALVSWIGRQHGLAAGLLLPLVWGSVPVLFNFQFGQFQLMAIALSVGAMLAFERERYAFGGFLLAVAVLGKVFPGILGLWLLFRGAWRAAVWTCAWGLALIALSFVVLEPATFGHFLFEQIPRLASGDIPPYFKDSIGRIGINISVYGLPFKLQTLGWIGNAEAIAGPLTWSFVLALVALAYRGARAKDQDRHSCALMWVALLALASLRSPYVPSVYGYAGAIWLLSLLAPRAAGRAVCVAVVVLAWGLLGPLPPSDDPGLLVATSLLGPLVFLLVGFLALRPRPSAAPSV